MAIELTADQLKQAQANLKRNAPGRNAAPPRVSVRVRAQQGARAIRNHPAPKSALRVTRRGYGRVAKTKAYKAGAGGFAAILVLLIGMGITIAVIRKPALVTAPLAFIGDITSATNRITSIGQKKAV